jgi:hypothetical protein
VSEFLVHGLSDRWWDAIAGDGAEGDFAGGPDLFFAIELVVLKEAIELDAVDQSGAGAAEVELAFVFGEALAVEDNAVFLEDELLFFEINRFDVVESAFEVGKVIGIVSDEREFIDGVGEFDFGSLDEFGDADVGSFGVGFGNGEFGEFLGVLAFFPGPRGRSERRGDRRVRRVDLR